MPRKVLDAYAQLEKDVLKAEKEANKEVTKVKSAWRAKLNRAWKAVEKKRQEDGLDSDSEEWDAARVPFDKLMKEAEKSVKAAERNAKKVATAAAKELIAEYKRKKAERVANGEENDSDSD